MKALYHCKEAVLVQHTSDVPLTPIWPCCTPVLHLPSAMWCLSSFFHQPCCSQLARRGKSFFSPLVPVAQNLGCSEQPQVVATHSNTNALLLAILQPMACHLWGCQLLAAPRVGRNLRSVRGRKSVSLHSADTILFFKRKLSSLCISVSLRTSRHTSDPASLPPAEITALLNTLPKSLSEISGKLIRWALDQAPEEVMRFGESHTKPKTLAQLPPFLNCNGKFFASCM